MGMRGKLSCAFGMSPGSLGALSELRISAELLKKNFAVFRSVSPSCFVDLIATKNDLFLKIEVRTGRRGRKNELEYANKVDNKADCVAVYLPTEDKIYFFDRYGKDFDL